VLDLGREEHAQAGSLKLHKLRLDFFDHIVRNGTIVANILAQDPSKAAEAASFLDKQLAENRHTAIEAMKVLLDGDAIRYGELDDAVGAVVERFRSIVTQPASIAQSATASAAAITVEPATPPDADGPRS
jgi:hypothetical protein